MVTEIYCEQFAGAATVKAVRPLLADVPDPLASPEIDTEAPPNAHVPGKLSVTSPLPMVEITVIV
jgi:hypothetical protein